MSDFIQWRPHPWHGLSIGNAAPELVNAFIEITPFDLVKYEVDKETGYLRVDRPHKTSSLPPTLYGFVPRTYCGERVKSLMPGAERGDGGTLLQDHPDAWEPEDLRIALRIEPDVKLLPCVAMERDSVRDVLLELLYTILEDME